MDRQLLVLGCSQSKRETPGLLPAIDRYDGSSYRVLRSYLRERQWPTSLSVAILSAKYGLVGGFTGFEDYDERMTPLGKGKGGKSPFDLWCFSNLLQYLAKVKRRLDPF